MLSFGIEYDLAFSIAFWSARLFVGSGPPCFAATMIAFDSFEKSWPRLASAAPFLCLIEDHLLCPDNLPLLHEFQEALMQPRVVGQLGVERGDEEAALARKHRPALDLCQHLHVRADVLHPGSPDEHRTHRRAEAGDLEVGLERSHLSPERVPADGDVDETEVIAVQHDHAGARPEHRPVEAADRLVEAVEPHQAHERRRLATGDHEPVEAVELLRLAPLDRVRTEPTEHLHVLTEVSLHGENADPKRLHVTNGIGVRAK